MEHDEPTKTITSLHQFPHRLQHSVDEQVLLTTPTIHAHSAPLPLPPIIATGPVISTACPVINTKILRQLQALLLLHALTNNFMLRIHQDTGQGAVQETVGYSDFRFHFH